MKVDKMAMKTENTLKFNDYDYDEFDMEHEFLLGELKDGEIRQKIITPNEILENHLKNPYQTRDEIEIENPFDKPVLRKYILVQDVNDEFIDLIYYEHKIDYIPYRFISVTGPVLRGCIKLNK